MLYKIIIPLIGLVFLALTYIFVRISMQFFKEGQHISALVKEVSAEHNFYMTDYYPIFEYELNGQVYTTRYKLNSRFWKDKEGTRHTIIVNPQNPISIKLYSFWGLLIVPIILSCISVTCFTVFGWFIWYEASFL